MHDGPQFLRGSNALTPSLSVRVSFARLAHRLQYLESGDKAQMDETMNPADNYRIEVSGWGFESDFFVEQTGLLCDEGGEKKVFLHHTVSEKAIVFVRLLLPESLNNTLPVAYQVAAVQPMNCSGQCEVRLRQLHPRSKVPQRAEDASHWSTDSKDACEQKESSARLEHEEILQ
jgi:hypothetical protein